MPDKSKLWYLKNINVLDGMSDAQMQMVEKLTSMAHLAKHHPIYFPEQPSNNVFFLKEGHVKLYRLHEDGREVILDVLGPGEIFGELALVDQGVRGEAAETLDDALVCTVTMKDFESLLMHNPAFTLRLTKWIGLRLRRFEEKISDMVFKDVTKRIIGFLVRYAEDFGRMKEGTVHISSFLSHQEIAYLTATSRQTVTTVLNELKTQGLIGFDRSSMVVHNLKQLQALAK
ncbi:MAG: Crp/Fnr family transcriptional regulator [Bacteroidetes bacterium]|nr:Crp/Fnr family transcriptional regulator [Bacteroidota bacterium]MCW5894534.1 Crp/Fnr family transcriptional regulator [Bacteroidota bacterium]